MAEVDPRAVVHDGAQLADGVSIGPFAVIGPGVSLGRGTVVCSHAVVEGSTEAGEDNWIGPFAYIGGPPQHTDYKGEDTKVRIGKGNRIREYTTIHRGTAEGGGVTSLGSHNFIMVGCHLAHDCTVGDRVVMANLTSLSGHVQVEDDAVIGGMVGVHQHCKVGTAVMVAGMARIVKDVPPYSMVGGEPPRFLGLNRVGLKRTGVQEGAKRDLRRAYRFMFEKGVLLEHGIERAEKELGGTEEVARLIRFVRESERGIIRD